MALGDLDEFPFFLARQLSMSLAEIREMPMVDYFEWRGYFRWLRWRQDHAADVRAHKRGARGR